MDLEVACAGCLRKFHSRDIQMDDGRIVVGIVDCGDVFRHVEAERPRHIHRRGTCDMVGDSQYVALGIRNTATCAVDLENGIQPRGDKVTADAAIIDAIPFIGAVGAFGACPEHESGIVAACGVDHLDDEHIRPATHDYSSSRIEKQVVRPREKFVGPCLLPQTIGIRIRIDMRLFVRST